MWSPESEVVRGASGLRRTTEEFGHTEMLATAVALNLEKAPVTLQEEMAADSMVGAMMGGMNPRHILSTGLSATRENANGVPFNMSHIYASGNLAGDMYCNVEAESTGRTLACRLHHMTDNSGMKDMLAFMIARDTMHQEQWLAVLEELGPKHLPIPNSFPQSEENQEFSYKFFITTLDKELGTQEGQPWTSGDAPDGNGTMEPFFADPLARCRTLVLGGLIRLVRRNRAMGRRQA